MLANSDITSLPMATWVYLALYILTLFVHFVFMAYVLGGGVYMLFSMASKQGEFESSSEVQLSSEAEPSTNAASSTKATSTARTSTPSPSQVYRPGRWVTLVRVHG